MADPFTRSSSTRRLCLWRRSRARSKRSASRSVESSSGSRYSWNMTSRIEPDPEALEALVRSAQAGDRAALELVVSAIQPQVHGLAWRFLWHPEDAEDATQEILVRIVTRLAGFRGASAFRTWVFRVACNTLLNTRRRRMEERALTLEAFADDLTGGLSDEPVAIAPPVEEALLVEEVKIGCTTAMLLCLDREHRLAY